MSLLLTYMVIGQTAVPGSVVMTEPLPAPAEGAELSIIDNARDPETLTVAAAATVTWTNAGESNHFIDIFRYGQQPDV